VSELDLRPPVFDLAYDRRVGATVMLRAAAVLPQPITLTVAGTVITGTVVGPDVQLVLPTELVSADERLVPIVWTSGAVVFATGEMVTNDDGIEQPDIETTVVIGENNVTVEIVGAPGPAGPAGASAFEHVQSTPSASWVVTHNLGRRAVTEVYDATDSEVVAEVAHTTTTATVVWAAPATGRVVCI